MAKIYKEGDRVLILQRKCNPFSHDMGCVETVRVGTFIRYVESEIFGNGYQALIHIDGNKVPSHVKVSNILGLDKEESDEDTDE